jgi:hypothetical protein
LKEKLPLQISFSFKTENEFFHTFSVLLPKSRYERSISINISKSGPIKAGQQLIKKKQNNNNILFTFDWKTIGKDNQRLILQLF